MSLHFTYDVARTWEENCRRGPRFADAGLQHSAAATPMKSFLGIPVRSRIGIAAGLLLNRRWVVPYAQRGFDLLSYKTVRSAARPSYPLPNWVFVEDNAPPDGPVVVTETPPTDPTRISSSVCFGMPSVSPAEWRDDVRRTRAELAAGQALIVSIVGTPSDPPSLEGLAEDFARCAEWAAEAGAHVVEANLSCPNVCSAEGTLYLDAHASRTVAQSIREAIGRTPLLLKVGSFTQAGRMRDFLRAVEGLAGGVTLVNCISRPVLGRDGQPAFGESFRMAGVLGRAIHEPSLAAVRAAKDLIRADQLSLEVAAVGGVSTVDDIGDFFVAGADAVLCGSSPMYLPNLAQHAKQAHPEW